MKSILTIAAAFAVAHHASAAFFADQVVSFTPGTGQTQYLNPQAVLGEPGPLVETPPYPPTVFSLFSGHYEDNEMTRVAPGGSLTLRLSNYVSILPGVPEIGVFEGIFFTGSSTINGAVGTGSSLVEVSEDGQNWYSLNSGQPIVFDMAATYFLNSGPFDSAVPENPSYADFGKPFLGSAADFIGKTYSEAVAALGGSAGGTWLDLDEVPLSQVGFIRFTGAGTSTLEINAVSINTAAAGGAVPEPSSAVVLAVAAGFLGLIRRRRS